MAAGLLAGAVIGLGACGGGTEDPEGASSSPGASGKEAAPPAETSAYDEDYGTFKPLSKSGKGDSIVKLPKGATSGIVVMTHKGSSNFAVNVLDADNQATGDLLANEIGKYKGTAAFGLIDMGDPAKLKVSADGPWTIKVQPISSAKQLSPTQKGTGANVLLYDGDAADWAITHKGESNFAVNQVGGTFPNLAVNEIGKYKGTVPLDGGPSVVMISADGAWSFTRQ